jgi:hypothetical protein
MNTAINSNNHENNEFIPTEQDWADLMDMAPNDYDHFDEIFENMYWERVDAGLEPTSMHAGSLSRFDKGDGGIAPVAGPRTAL